MTRKQTSKRIGGIIFSLCASFLFAAFCLIAVPGPAFAKVTGQCGNCHTMHNMQGGTAVNGSGPFSALVVNTCLGCHTGTNDGTNVIPYVMSSSEPVYNLNTLAGGNFYWVKQGNNHAADGKGHNIFLNEVDATLSQAPGGTVMGCGTNSCHDNLCLPFSDGPGNPLKGIYGCQGCHLKPRHHANDGSGSYKVVNSADQGWYRFLSQHDFVGDQGVIGGEDGDWQYTKGPADHNEYLGKVVDFTSIKNLSAGNSVSLYCCGCHGEFHKQKRTTGNEWIRHPSDALLPAGTPDTEYEAYVLYNPLAPVAREAVPASPGSTVTADHDMVMCLSCHRPHGSPYADILRWPYAATDETGAGSPFAKAAQGCTICHTQKIP